MADSRDITGKNRKFKGTSGIVLPKGTQAQRADTESGELRFNTDTNLAEYYDGTEWKAIDSPPGVDSVSPANPVDDGSTITLITLTGTNFQSGLVLDLIGSDATVYNVSSFTLVSSTSITFNYTSAIAVAGVNSPYNIRVTNPTGLSGTLSSGLTPNTKPSFNTDSGSLGSIELGANASTLNQISVSDTSGGTLVYSISTGALPDGVSIDSGTGALSGVTTASGTFNFTVQVTDGTTAVERAFSAIVINPHISATGGTVTESGNYKIHTFTGSGCFTVSAAPSAPVAIVDYVVVAGGGGGGYHYGGAGGAGGYRESYNATTSGCYTASPLATPISIPVTTTTYPITVGSGGPGSSASPWKGSNGGNSVFSTITSTGGGAGAGTNSGTQSANPGGSGGGAGGTNTGGGGGTGNSPPVSPPQGNPGSPDSSSNQGAGSGGAGGSGSGKVGGAATTTQINPAAGQPGPNGDLRYFAGGANAGPPAGEPAPAGGRTYGQSGLANSGQGAAGDSSSGSAGSGVVIIRYKFQ